MLQIDFVTALFTKAKELGIHCTLDTCGFTFRDTPEYHEIVDKLLAVTDLVLLDLKEINPKQHIVVTRQPNTNILAFARYLSDKKIPVWIRHVLVPGLTDFDEDLMDLIGNVDVSIPDELCDFYKGKTYFEEAKATKFNNKINTLRGTDIYMSPILYNGLKASKEDVQHNLYKSDVFSLGYTLLYAISLNYDIINELRDLDDIEKIKKILYEKLKPRFSDNFIELILRMINPDEHTRIDFIGLDKLIKDLL